MNKLLIINLVILSIIHAGNSVQDMTKLYLESRNNFSKKTETNKSKIHYSSFLHELLKNGKSLPPHYIESLSTLGFNIDGNFIKSSRPQLDRYLDNGLFRYHYTLVGNDAIDTADTDNNDIPDYLDFIVNTFNHVNTINFDTLGYLIPPSDGSYTTENNGGSKHYDIYIYNLESGYYGYVQGENYAQNNSQIYRGDNENSESVKESSAMTSFMALRNNYSAFSGKLNEILEVTIAHEFFHAIQYGYDGWEAGWLLESTAVWMEELHYDHINDCYQFLNNNFEYPEHGLFYDTNRGYGSYIFFSYLEDKYLGTNYIKEIFEKAVHYYSYDFDYSLDPILDVLSLNNLEISRIFNNLSITNIILDNSVTPELYQFVDSNIVSIKKPYISNYFNTISDSVRTYSNQEIWSSGTIYYKFKNLDSTLKTISTSLIDSINNTDSYQLTSIRKVSDGVYNINTAINQTLNTNYGDEIIFSATFYNGYNTTPSNYAINFIKNYTSTNEDTVTEETLSIEKSIEIPTNYNLILYPNPFNPSINIYFDLPFYSKILINIYNLKGEIIETLLNDYINSGGHSILWDASNVSSGVYLIQFKNNNDIRLQKIILAK